ncbi:hypothetical protein KIPB_000128 [Kipferlia bialata]|uniref:SUI1 domain-containing protein n=1 Tax=Kipferlia bialata TaxID=797122 RepID=A0A9K3CNC0_9EUKA|nr:hypothetical protein KIPB_000128 [Kipferlia bialata]|eukprot:g128.t1
MSFREVEYCPLCGVPFEYCGINGSRKAAEACKAWLQANRPELFTLIHNEEADAAVNPLPTTETAPQKAKQLAVPPFGCPRNPAKHYDACVQVRIAQGCGRKQFTQIDGYDLFPQIEAKKLVKQFRHRFACGVAETELYSGGMVIEMQGAYVNECKAIMLELGIPKELVLDAAPGKKGGRKKGPKRIEKRVIGVK